jgi:hypothetical protein
MKTVLALVATVILGSTCSNKKQSDLDNTVIEYTANTRGFYQKIILANHKLSVSNERNGTEKPTGTAIADADWKELVMAFQTIELNDLATLKAPTKKRFHDGAAIANLKIVHQEKTYQSTSFDHGTPPKEIEKLVNKINALVETN